MFCLYGIIRMIVPQGHVYLAAAAAAVDTKALFIVFVKRGVPRTSLNGLLVFSLGGTGARIPYGGGMV